MPDCQVKFVEGDNIRDFLFPDLFQNPFILPGHPFGAVNDQNGNIRLVENLVCFSDAQSTQLPFVIQPRGIDHHYRPKRQQLHGLLHRIGGGALYIRDNGKVLAGDGIDQAGFPRISFSEDPDVNAVCGRCGI